MLTFDDLPKVKLGLGHMSSISNIGYSYRVFSLTKFHINKIILRFFLYYYYMVTFNDLLKVKKGHGQMGSILDFVHGYRIFKRSKVHTNFTIPRLFL